MLKASLQACQKHSTNDSPTTPPLITRGTTPSQHDFYMHHPNTTAKAFHTARTNDWLVQIRPKTTTLSPLPWTDLTWNLAGSIITKYSKTSSCKLFLLKVLYDALPNIATLNTNTPQNPAPQTNPPPLTTIYLRAHCATHLPQTP